MSEWPYPDLGWDTEPPPWAPPRSREWYEARALAAFERETAVDFSDERVVEGVLVEPRSR